jgi:hypothetical protein
VGRRGPGAALPNELWYAGVTFMLPQWDFDESMALVEDPLADDLETRPGAGSLVSSAPDYLRFLRAYFHTGEPKPASLIGYSWGYTFYGGGPGECSATRELIQPDGSSLEWALLVNESDKVVSLDTLREQLDTFFAGVTAWPATDAFHTPVFHESGALVAMEAENFTTATPAKDAGPWQVQTTQTGYTGLGYLTMASGGNSPATWTNAATANYTVHITTPGDYNVWVLRYSNGCADNAAYIGVDGVQVGATFDDSTANPKKWAWYKFGTKARFSSPGLHTFTLKRKERDYKIDRIVLTKGAAAIAGAGPAESPRF